MSIFSDIQSAARRHGAPGTGGLVATLVIFFLILWLGGIWVFRSLAFDSATALTKPWTFFTYPFVTGAGTGPLGLFFLCMWLWGIGGWVEKDLGTPKYLATWFAFSGLCALGVFIGSLVLGHSGAFVGAWTAVAALTIIWGTRNPDAPLRLMFVLPITGKYLAWLAAALVLFGTTPAMAPFAAVPLALAYAFAANKLPFATYSRGGYATKPSRQETMRDKRYYEEVRHREKEREERERLRKLFEGSLTDDPDRD
jgi:hypothetical protein